MTNAEVARLAIPIYKARYANVPFYKDWKDETWLRFVFSRINEARYLVEHADGK